MSAHTQGNIAALSPCQAAEANHIPAEVASTWFASSHMQRPALFLCNRRCPQVTTLSGRSLGALCCFSLSSLFEGQKGGFHKDPQPSLGFCALRGQGLVPCMRAGPAQWRALWGTACWIEAPVGCLSCMDVRWCSGAQAILWCQGADASGALVPMVPTAKRPSLNASLGLCSDGPHTAKADLELTQALCSSKLLAGLLHLSLLQISELCLKWLSQTEFSGSVRGLLEAQGTLRPETISNPQAGKSCAGQLSGHQLCTSTSRTEFAVGFARATGGCSLGTAVKHTTQRLYPPTSHPALCRSLSQLCHSHASESANH